MDEFMDKIHFLAFLILFGCGTLHATDYYRCGDAGGNMTFSEKPCGPDAVVETVEDSYLGGQDRHTERSAIEQLENYRKEVRKVEKITGKKINKKNNRIKEEPCDHASSHALRNARVSNDVMKCHSMDDVRHIHGEPDSVYTWSDRSSYDTRWTYRNDEKDTLYIYFKKKKVTKWNARRKR